MNQAMYANQMQAAMRGIPSGLNAARVYNMPSAARPMAAVMANPFDASNKTEVVSRFSNVREFLNACTADPNTDPAMKSVCAAALTHANAAENYFGAALTGSISFDKGYEEATYSLNEMAKALQALDPRPVITREQLLNELLALNAAMLMAFQDEWDQYKRYGTPAVANSMGGLSMSGAGNWASNNWPMLALLGGGAILAFWMVRRKKRAYRRAG